MNSESIAEHEKTFDYSCRQLPQDCSLEKAIEFRNSPQTKLESGNFKTFVPSLKE